MQKIFTIPLLMLLLVLSGCAPTAQTPAEDETTGSTASGGLVTVFKSPT